MKRVILAAAAVLSLVGAIPALAGPADFAACDGYPAPDRRADNMTQGSWLFGAASRTAEVRRTQNSIGAAQVARCDAALADPLLLPQFWLRRGHLLQSKAMHQIKADNAEGALETLAASDAIGAANNDPFFVQSVGLGNRALRAIAWFRLDNRAAAIAELDAIDRARPYAADIRRLTRSILLANTPEIADQRALLMKSVPLNPSALSQLFWIAIFYGDFVQAALVSPQVSFDLPQGRDDWQIEGLDAHQLELIETRAEFAGATAYAWAATGRPNRSATALARARELLAWSAIPPVSPVADRPVAPAVLAAYEARKRMADKGSAVLDRWQAAIALREKAPTLGLDALARAVSAGGLRDSPVLFDLISRARPVTESDQTLQREMIANLEQRRGREIDTLWDVSFTELVKMLPRPERETMRPRYRRAGDGVFLGDSTGFYIKRDPTSAYITVRFGSELASRAMVEELGILAAAMEARKQGKDSFLMDSRMIVERTVQVYGYYGGLQSSYPNGNETRLRILPVNAAELPADLEHSRWRLISVADVIASVEPMYRPAARR